MSDIARARLRADLRRARVRLTLVAVAVAAVVLAITAVALVSVQREVLTDALDETLRDRAAESAASVAADNFALAPSTNGDALTQLVARDGTVIAASSHLIRGAAIAPDPGNGDAFRKVHVAGAPEPYRVLSRRIGTADDLVVVHVAINFDDVDESVAVLRNSLAIALPLVTIAIGVLVWLLTGRPLRRVERAMVHQQRFVADASHELRSPLARMRATLELELERSDARASPRPEAFDSLLADASEMQQLVEDLLFLARRDAEADSDRLDAVDLDDLVLSEAARLRERATLEVDTSGVAAARVRGNPSDLARAVRNLAENAERHALTRVTMAARTDGGWVEISVADDGPGVPESERGRVFERFARVDDARTRRDGGTGLGLAIVHEIAQQAGGSVFVDPNGTAGARFVLRLPASREER
jgi:signal transduction histidine kinase